MCQGSAPVPLGLPTAVPAKLAVLAGKQAEGSASQHWAKPPCALAGAGRESLRCSMEESLLPQPHKIPPGPTVLTQKHPHSVPQIHGMTS